LAHDGVALDRVDAVESATGVALIHVDDRGENCITVIAGANGRARAAHVPDTMLTPATTLLMQLELPLAEVAMLARRARARGARVVLNAAPASASARDLLDDIDVVIVDDGEAARLAADAGDAWVACRALAAGARIAVVTLGRNGALHATRAVVQHQRATPVDVVDTVGAGDAFTGALVAALDRGDDLARAVREGVAAGSLACLAAGAQRALPARDAIVRHALALPDALE
ncbi:MAG: PfkB family carbohydrate kinase, partial [Betaproteobacteria bacterium]